MELSNLKIKEVFFLFQEGTCKAWKTNISYIFLVVSRYNFILYIQFYLFEFFH